MATTSLKKLLGYFRGTESKKEEAAEKKLSPATYRRGEKAEGEKVKSTPAKKLVGSAVAKKPTFPVKKTAAKKK